MVTSDARQKVLGRIVGAHELPSENLDGAEFADQFRHAAQLLANIGVACRFEFACETADEFLTEAERGGEFLIHITCDRPGGIVPQADGMLVAEDNDQLWEYTQISIPRALLTIACVAVF